MNKKTDQTVSYFLKLREYHEKIEILTTENEKLKTELEYYHYKYPYLQYERIDDEHA